VTLTPGGSYVMLLETTQILKQGETFSCSLAFRKAGSRQIEVAVAAEGAQSAP
jgi:copper(I)-binding protein